MNTNAATRSFTGTPGNRRDRARFDALTYWDRAIVCKIAGRLYDGSRTVARCWAEALDAVEDLD